LAFFNTYHSLTPSHHPSTDPIPPQSIAQRTFLYDTRQKMSFTTTTKKEPRSTTKKTSCGEWKKKEKLSNQLRILFFSPNTHNVAREGAKREEEELKILLLFPLKSLHMCTIKIERRNKRPNTNFLFS
jgi:hypothetical protein